MLWEGGWEWARLTKSKYILIEVTCPPSPTPYVYILLLPPIWGTLAPLALGLAPPPPKICIPFVAVLKKSKKRQARTLLLKIRCARIALAACPADFCSSSIF